jgi:hypothetical protein
MNIGLIEGNEAFADGILGQLRHTLEVELIHDLLSAGFDGLHSDTEGKDYFLGALTLGNQL